MKFKNLIPKVVGKGLKKFKYDPSLIYMSLLKETDITREDAKRIVEKTTRFLIANSIKFISPPLIREVVNVNLLKAGLEKERLQYTRIGLPFKDLDELFKQFSEKERITRAGYVYDWILREFNEVKQLIDER